MVHRPAAPPGVAPGARALMPGVSVLGGAAAGLSYEGVLRDAMAREQRDRDLEAGHSAGAPLPRKDRQARRDSETPAR